jgi:hypothetical protein
MGGRNLDIKVYWKNNNTIIIEMKKISTGYQKKSNMRCFLNKVDIIYIEK